MNPCRLIFDLAAPGPWNMAVDEMLLQQAAQGGVCSLRFYGWSRPTVSLGYFQPHASRACHPPSLHCPWVRRASGGGAIVHDRELTYCLALPAGNPLAGDSMALYTAVHQAMIDVLAGQGIPSALHAAPTAATGELDFLCFKRRTTGDLVAGGAKIAGSAQRRRQGAVLQHGSLLLGTSAAAPDLPGIEGLFGVLPHGRHWTDLLAAAMAARLGLDLSDHHLSGGEQQRASELVGHKYAAWQWSQREPRRQAL